MRVPRALFLLPVATLCAAQPSPAGDLVLATSLKYDALCCVGLLTGGQLYTARYPQEYARFTALMDDRDRAAFHELRRVITDENKGLPGPLLTLYLSASEAETIDGLQAALSHPESLRATLRGTPYYDEQEWKTVFVPAIPALIHCLGFLKRVGFETIWHAEYEPRILARIQDLNRKIGGTRFIDMQAKLLGFRPVQGPMTAYLCYFPKPHGIRVTGPRYITAYDYPLDIILSNAVHEPMHSPFRPADDPALWKALAPLKADPDLMQALEHHDPSFGYNTFEGLVEEDCVQALEQLIEERMGVARPAGERWAKADDGLHILAAAVYELMKEDGYNQRGGSFQDWLADPKTMERLTGHVKALSKRIIQPAAAPSAR